jgi:hypothetical protein
MRRRTGPPAWWMRRGDESGGLDSIAAKGFFRQSLPANRSGLSAGVTGFSAMPGSLWGRWLRGLGLSFYASVLLGIAWAIPQAAGQFLDESRGIPEWLRIVLGVLWGFAMLVFCPLALEWLTRKFGITMGDKGAGLSKGKLEGPRVAATPIGDGKKRCGGCGSIVNAYAVRCHLCKAVFVEEGGSDHAEPVTPADRPRD